MNTDKSKEPLYKVLNEKRLNGYKFSDEEIKSFVPDGWEFFMVRDYGYGQIGVKYRRPYLSNEFHYNEDGFEYKETFHNPKNVALKEYTALAVNNLAPVADALQCLLDVDPLNPVAIQQAQIKAIKALKAIS